MTGFFTTVSCVVRSTAVRCSAALPAATRSADMPSTALSTVTFPSDALVLNAWDDLFRRIFHADFDHDEGALLPGADRRHTGVVHRFTAEKVFHLPVPAAIELPTQTRPSNWTPIPVPKARVPPEKKPCPRPFCPPPEQTRAVPVQLPRLRRSRSAAERPDRAAPQAPCSFAALHRTIFVSSFPPPPECVEMCRFYLTVFCAVCQSFRQRFAPKFFSENWADSTILIVFGRERPLPAVLRVSSLTKSR